MGQALLAAACAQTPPTVLVVDDNETARALFRRLLTRRGYVVYEAADGAAALEQTAFEQPDLILLDLRLPDIDGAEVLRQLRIEHDAEELPILMVSGERDGEVAAGCVSLGANDFLMKPVFPAVLYARMSTFVAIRSARAERRSLNQASRSAPEPLGSLFGA